MFGITRVPKPNCDVLVGQHPSHARHIIVMVKDQIYAMDVYDSKNGARITIESIEKYVSSLSLELFYLFILKIAARQLEAVLEKERNTPKKQAPIGLFTGTHRDYWTKYHAHLETISPVNRESFNKIETALFAVSLDEGVYSTVDSFARKSFGMPLITAARILK